MRNFGISEKTGKIRNFGRSDVKTHGFVNFFFFKLSDFSNSDGFNSKIRTSKYPINIDYKSIETIMFT